MKKNLRDKVKKNAILFVAIVCALITSLIVKPDNKYFEYINYDTLITLFCMLAIVCGLERINFFQIMSRKIVSNFKTTRSSILVLVYITFIGSMIIANDMALITFLPLGYYVLSNTGQNKYMAVTFILQNIAANLGGMLTPFGNPQNLYMYSFFNIPSGEFVEIMFWPFIISIVMITIYCLMIPKHELKLENDYNEKLNIKKSIVNFLLFILFLGVIFRLVEHIIGAVIVIIVYFIIDKKVLRKLDYPLLMTFFSFFIFSGNLSRITVIRTFLESMLDKNTLITGVFSCQFISNVPSAILLSKFTNNYAELLVAVNIGGVGTLIASLASLITYREFVKHNPNKQFYYIKMFSLFNFSFLFILTFIFYIKYH